MRVADLAPSLVLVVGGAAGLAAGLAGARLCDALPPLYAVTHLVTGPKRRYRNTGVIVLTVAIALWLAHLVTLAPEASAALATFYFLTNLVLAAGVIAAAAVDLEHMILPNELTYGGAALALLTAYWRGVGLGGALIGGVVGLALTYLPFVLYKRLRGRSGMGLGDAKLAVLAGLWLGPWGVVWVILAGSAQAALLAIVANAIGRPIPIPESVQRELAELREIAARGGDGGDGGNDEEAAEARRILADDPMAADVGVATSAFDRVAKTRLPMGPSLVLACLEFVVFRSRILSLFEMVLS